MLDYVAIFTKGGALLWAWQMGALRGDPVRSLVRSCLLEDRGGEKAFTYTPPAGGPYTIKWSLHNALQLVVVAVYSKALSLLYVDQLLEEIKQAFTVRHYQPRLYEYPRFDATFRRLLSEADGASKVAREPTKSAPRGGKGSSNGQSHQDGTVGRISGESNEDEDGCEGEGDASRGAARQLAQMAVGGRTSETNGTSSGGSLTPDGGSGSGSGSNTDDVDGKRNSNGNGHNHRGNIKGGRGGVNGFDVAALAKKGGGTRRRTGSRALDASPPKAAAAKGPRKKEARNWTGGGTATTTTKDNGKKDANQLDRSATPGQALQGGDSMTPLDMGVSMVDVDDDLDEDVYSDDEVVAGAVSEKKGGFMSSLVRTLGVNVMGTAALTADDVAPALEALRRKLMQRNVACEIADKVVDSVRGSLEGRALGSLQRVSTAVRAALEQALTRILTPARSIDILREVRAAQAKGQPYTIVFVGVNGVGKSTNLAKIAYWLGQNDVKVMIAACDTFRSGAVEQLKTHCSRLGVPLFERGYEKDPARVAAEAVKAAKQQGIHAVLVDTAGRMQDNEPLMRALSSLIVTNNPDLVLFVGEALVGNDAVDQLSKFKSRLADLATGTGPPHTIDGIVLTKMDAIDEKVGAALSMVYTSGAPIMFCGVGQTYVDLKRLQVKSVVASLLK